MLSKPIKAVIFDLDNTLVASNTLKKYRDNKDEEGLENALNTAFLFAPVKEMLDQLTHLDVQLGIVTNSPRWYAEKLLEYFEIGDYFDSVITYNDVTYRHIKPSPKGIHACLEELEISPSNQVIYVGDHDADMRAAYEAEIVPIAPSWATKLPIPTPPAAILQSNVLVECVKNTYEVNLIAERVSKLRTFNFIKKQLNFIPLNADGEVTALDRDKIEAIALGRYFSKKSFLTYKYHEQHELSLDIAKKEISKTYVVPSYFVDLLVHACDKISEFFFKDKTESFDIVTVIPAKRDGNPRLENLLRKIEEKSNIKSVFIPDIFEFKEGAISLKKTQGGIKARTKELNKSLFIKAKYREVLQSKNILIIDDVTTTSATLKHAKSLLTNLGANRTLGLCLAKTVSIREQRVCKKCFAPMRVRKGQKGIPFYGCSAYFETKCNYNERIFVKDCPKCESQLVIRANPKDNSRFLGCSTFPECEHTETYSFNDF